MLRRDDRYLWNRRPRRDSSRACSSFHPVCADEDEGSTVAEQGGRPGRVESLRSCSAAWDDDADARQSTEAVRREGGEVEIERGHVPSSRPGVDAATTTGTGWTW